MKEFVVASGADLQKNYKQIAENHLAQRFADSPEFEKAFLKTFSDMVFSQNADQLEILSKMNQNTLLNAVFKATEIGASFAKKEISLIPFQEFKKVTEKGVERKIATGKYDAVAIVDINFQKQQILKLPNCCKFFVVQVHEGMKIITDLESGNRVFHGENNSMKPTIGYYAVFISTDGQRYDLFMSNTEIVERARFSPNFKEGNYKNPSNNIHYEKIVVRNLLKSIPKLSEELSSIVAYDEVGNTFEDVEYIEVVNETTPLEEVKKELAKSKEKPETKKAGPKKEQKAESKKASTKKEEPEKVEKSTKKDAENQELNDFF